MKSLLGILHSDSSLILLARSSQQPVLSLRFPQQLNSNSDRIGARVPLKINRHEEFAKDDDHTTRTRAPSRGNMKVSYKCLMFQCQIVNITDPFSWCTWQCHKRKQTGGSGHLWTSRDHIQCWDVHWRQPKPCQRESHTLKNQQA